MAVKINASGTSARLTALAIAIFLIALTLTAWRAVQIFAPVNSGTHSHALTETLEAVAGQGRVKITESKNAAGSRSLFILIDREAAASAAEVKNIATVASGYDIKSGERILVREADFATTQAAPAPTEFAELAVMVLLVFASGALALLTVRAPEVAAPHFAPAPILPTIHPAPQAGLAPAQRPQANAADLVQRDPAKAADVVRSWMSGEGRS